MYLLPAAPPPGGCRESSLTHPSALLLEKVLDGPPIRPQSSASVLQHSWPLTPVEYLLDARCVDRLHGLVDPEKWSTPCKGGVVLAETAEIVRGGRGRGEMQEGRTNREKREQGKEEKRKEKWEKKEQKNANFSLKAF